MPRRCQFGALCLAVEQDEAAEVDLGKRWRSRVEAGRERVRDALERERHRVKRVRRRRWMAAGASRARAYAGLVVGKIAGFAADLHGARRQAAFAVADRDAVVGDRCAVAVDSVLLAIAERAAEAVARALGQERKTDEAPRELGVAVELAEREVAGDCRGLKKR